MCSSSSTWRSVATCVLLAVVGCGPEDTLELRASARSVEPAFGYTECETHVTVRGAMPVKPTVSLSGGDPTVEAAYRAWVGDTELADVRWIDGETLEATVPTLPEGSYPLVIESPFGDRSSIENGFRVWPGSCDTAAALTLTATVDAETVHVGDTVRVTATVANRGESAASAVTAAVTAPARFELTSGAVTPQDVPAGSSRTFTWVFAVRDGASRGTFTVTAAGTDASSGAPVTAEPFTTGSVAVEYAVGGTVSGLEGAGLVLQLNGANDLTVVAAAGAPVSFTFPVTIASGSAFEVTVLAQPSGPTQTCTVTGGTGSVGTGPVTSVVVNCGVNTFTVGGTVTGLAGSGLVLVETRSNQEVALTSTGTYAFQVPIRSGGPYAVAVKTQPAAPTQTCTVSNGAGTVGGTNVTNVDVTCVTSSFTVGGSVTGLAGTGLVLQLNGGNDLPVTTSGFTFPAIPSGTAYAVTVRTQPSGPTQACTVSNGTGVVGAANVTNVAVSCATSSFTVGGSVTGLAGTGLVLRVNGGSSLPVPAGATSFTFPTPLPSGTAYAVTVSAQPTGPTQTCTVTNGSGVVGGANVTSVAVACATSGFTVGGSVTGLAGTGLVLQLNGGNDLTVTANGTFAFPSLASGTPYAVTVASQPTGPIQTCTVSNGSGTVGSTNVTNVGVSCSTATFSIGGSISGLAGSGLVLRLNGGNNLTVASGATSFTFGTQLPSGSAYAVTVFAQPTLPTQVCTVTAGSGSVGAANVTSVAVACATSSFTVGGSVTGLQGSGLVLQLNGGNDLPVAASGTFTFPALASGTPYEVKVLSEPTEPTQTCTVSSGTGTVGGANVTNVAVSCATRGFTVGGSLSGLLGNNVRLLLTYGAGSTSALTLSADGAFTFAAAVPSGAAYAVTVTSQPKTPAQICAVANGSGTIAAGPVTSVEVTCTGAGFTLTTSVTGTGIIECGGEPCPPSADYSAGSVVQLTVDPASPGTFAGWVVDGAEEACPGTDPCSVTMDADHVVEARFVL